MGCRSGFLVMAFLVMGWVDGGDWPLAKGLMDSSRVEHCLGWAETTGPGMGPRSCSGCFAATRSEAVGPRRRLFEPQAQGLVARTSS